MSIRIRPATVLDAPALETIETQSWKAATSGGIDDSVYRGYLAERRDYWEALLADPRSTTTWVATRDGEVVGFICVEAVGPGHPQLIRVNQLHAVGDGAQQVGTALLGYAIADMPAFVNVPTDSQSWIEFWQGEGFSRTALARHASGIDLAVLERGEKTAD
ncbi:GNAT family N-acetyltransferase [Trueperella bialowiezensis]|uniref:N-acetyltransferase domain-containing protein n=1 Tax=Trueperella bialowiezensis TaxID=312285 RepID=A0A3S4WHD1_9ACTO|nr:GNAT family N-acetyltransferase [Trueperella bialowiezensis]VEI13989.1 Uncharacterised protein [Trueperella bialowiezensis]